MPYTIELLDNTPADFVRGELQSDIQLDGRFSAILTESGRRIIVKPVRLINAKEYCGQHPGECIETPFGPRPKRKRHHLLEWDDWVAFHDVVNDTLDRLRVSADVWANPLEKMDRGSKMWIRRGLSRRVKWDWEDDWSTGRRVQTWNHGTPGQFGLDHFDESPRGKGRYRG